MRPAEPGRRALLEAGHRLLVGADLGRVSVNAIVAEAGMAKGSFYQHWRSREEYVRTLHRAFHERLRERVQTAVNDLPPGTDRMAAALEAYLDGCLEESATKALLFQARTQNDLADEVAAQNRYFADLIRPDLERLGWPDVNETAILLVAVAAEVALQELAAGHALPTLRQTALRLAAPHATKR